MSALLLFLYKYIKKITANLNTDMLFHITASPGYLRDKYTLISIKSDLYYYDETMKSLFLLKKLACRCNTLI